MLVFQVVGSTRFGSRSAGSGPVVALLCRGMQGYQGIPSYLLDSIKNLLTVYEFGVSLSNRWESLFIKFAVFPGSAQCSEDGSNPWCLPLYSCMPRRSTEGGDGFICVHLRFSFSFLVGPSQGSLVTMSERSTCPLPNSMTPSGF